MRVMLIMDESALQSLKYRKEMNYFGIISIFLLILLLIIPNIPGKVIICLILFYTGSIFFWNFSNYLVIKTGGVINFFLQVAISFFLPLLGALFFYYFSHDIDILEVIKYFDIWSYVILIFLAIMGWSGGKHLHKQRPFRGFLVCFYLVFLICAFNFIGLSTEDGFYNDTGLYVDEEKRNFSRQTGYHLILFILYITITYFFMILRFIFIRHNSRATDFSR